VTRLFIRLHATSEIGGDTAGSKQSLVLAHVERGAADGIGLEETIAEVVDEEERREDEGRGTRQLGVVAGSDIG